MRCEQKAAKIPNRREVLKYGLYGGLASILAPTLWLSGCKTQRNKGPNIILIILDTARAEALNVLTEQTSLVPNIDKISREGTTFARAFTPAPWTVPSHASLFTGHYAHKHNAIHDHLTLSNRFQTMAEILRSLGYTTGGFTCNPWLCRKSGLEQGFDTYEEVYDKLSVLEADQGAAKATESVIKWVNQCADDGKHFFLFVNYLEAHLPYKPPVRILNHLNSMETKPIKYSFSLGFPLKLAELYSLNRIKLSPEELASVRALYRAEIAYLDEHIGMLNSCLRTRGILDDTLLIITSDHGENLGEHGLMGHEFSVFDTVLHIPLIVRYPPALPAGESVEAPVSLIDILPTILEILGDHDHLDELEGVSLIQAKNFQSNKTRSILAEYSRPRGLISRYWRNKYPRADFSRYDVSLKALRKGQFKYVVSGSGEEFLYNVAEDAAEQTNVSGSFPEQLSRLRAELAVLSPTVAPTEEKSIPFTPEQRKQLESLGYF